MVSAKPPAALSSPLHPYARRRVRPIPTPIPSAAVRSLPTAYSASPARLERSGSQSQRERAHGQRLHVERAEAGVEGDRHREQEHEQAPDAERPAVAVQRPGHRHPARPLSPWAARSSAASLAPAASSSSTARPPK